MLVWFIYTPSLSQKKIDTVYNNCENDLTGGAPGSIEDIKKQWKGTTCEVWEIVQKLN